jgi:hypothetical protein
VVFEDGPLLQRKRERVRESEREREGVLINKLIKVESNSREFHASNMREKVISCL